MVELVTQYALKVRTESNTAVIKVRLSNNATHTLAISSLDEFNAVANVLRHEPVYFDPETGEIWTGSETVED